MLSTYNSTWPPTIPGYGRYPKHPPLNPLTTENTGPAIIIVIYILASLSIVATVILFWLSIYCKIAFGFDDATYSLANVRLCPSFCSQCNLTDSLSQTLGNRQHGLWHLAVTTGL
jgi:hypothetical protein